MSFVLGGELLIWVGTGVLLIAAIVVLLKKPKN